MAGTLTVDTIQSDSSYASTLNVASKINFAAGMQIGGQDTTFGGMRNRLINGNMVISQRHQGTSVTYGGAGGYGGSFEFPVDRWRIIGDGNRFSVQQMNSANTAAANYEANSAPEGFTNSVKITSVSSGAISAANRFEQSIEGYNIADLRWGTANAKPITISFWVKSSLTGNFGAAIWNSGSGAVRTYAYNYTISAANTWEYKTVTIPGPTDGDWPIDNQQALVIQFSLGANVSYTGTANTWGTSVYMTPTSHVSLVGTNNATLYITGVQVEKGSAASPFEQLHYGHILTLCHRYYQDFRYGGQRLGSPLVNYVIGDGSRVPIFPGLVQMRTAPTITTYAGDGTTSGVFTMFSAGTNITVSSVAQNSGAYIGSGYVQLASSSSNPVYFGATYDAEML
jgi:hypothetical protein